MSNETWSLIAIGLNIAAMGANLLGLRLGIRARRRMQHAERRWDEAYDELSAARAQVEAVRTRIEARVGKVDDVEERLKGMPNRLRFIKSPTDPERVRILEGFPFSVRETAIGKPFRAYHGDKEIGQFDTDEDAMSHCVMQAITSELKDRGIEIDEAQGIQIDRGGTP
jgi:hypothetical protein